MERAELTEQLRRSGIEALAAMAAVPADRLDTAGYENGWSVRQIMAHVASMEFTYRRLPDIARGPRDAQATAGGGTFDMDGYNARQVARRANASPAALMDEFVRGRATLLATMAELDDTLLQVPLRSAGGVQGTLAEVLSQTAGGHVRSHSADFVQAAGGQAEIGVGQRAAAGVLLAAEEAAQSIESAPPVALRSRPTPEEWSAGGIAGHVIEMLPYWADKLQTLARDPNAPLSRPLDAPERLGGVVDGEKLDPAEAASRLRQAANEAAGGLRSVPASAWSHTVDHPRYGRMTLQGCADQLMVRHAREHLDQIVRTLAIALPKSGT